MLQPIANHVLANFTCDQYYTDIMYEGRSTLFIERVSPEVIYLRLPEKLVIEVKATGRYSFIRWVKNGEGLDVQPQQFSNYNEILVYGTTTHEDFGLYEVSLRAASLTTQRNVPSELDFSVVPPGMYYHARLINYPIS